MDRHADCGLQILFSNPGISRSVKDWEFVWYLNQISDSLANLTGSATLNPLSIRCYQIWRKSSGKSASATWILISWSFLQIGERRAGGPVFCCQGVVKDLRLSLGPNISHGQSPPAPAHPLEREKVFWSNIWTSKFSILAWILWWKKSTKYQVFSSFEVALHQIIVLFSGAAAPPAFDMFTEPMCHQNWQPHYCRASPGLTLIAIGLKTNLFITQIVCRQQSVMTNDDKTHSALPLPNPMAKKIVKKWQNNTTCANPLHCFSFIFGSKTTSTKVTLHCIVCWAALAI